MAKELWIERYRPNKVEDYVFVNNAQRHQVESWIKEKSIPHLLLSGSAGIGKTTLAKVLINEIGIEGYDVLEIMRHGKTTPNLFVTKLLILFK